LVLVGNDLAEVCGYKFLIADRENKRPLVLRDAQYEYSFAEAARQQV
jgi:hypothetical protein